MGTAAADLPAKKLAAVDPDFRVVVLVRGVRS
jgi:hypothetical protein